MMIIMNMFPIIKKYYAPLNVVKFTGHIYRDGIVTYELTSPARLGKIYRIDSPLPHEL